MKLHITIELTAFGFNEYERGAEVARILRDRADKFQRYGLPYNPLVIPVGGYLRDSNGNLVGTWEIED
jgi:hypothetical protein